jgi:hypothetical protein
MMVGITGLWLPIGLSAILVFVASAVIHLVLRYHHADWKAVPSEDKVRETLRSVGLAPGNYIFPHCGPPGAMSREELAAKFEKGPAGFLFIAPPGGPAMGKRLAQWFVYTIVAGILVAYVTGRTLATGADYLQVFRVAGTVAFLTYAGAEPLASIWKGVNWSTTVRHVADGLVYALLTAGSFGWLWPR